METKNLDIYGSAAIPWSRALDQLPAKDAAGEDAPPRTTWLSTVSPDGRPHTTGVGALWLDDRFYGHEGAIRRDSLALLSLPLD